jgi:pSer/pThr/pTyr-binding forkhead associated (FHA) protein
MYKIIKVILCVTLFSAGRPYQCIALRPASYALHTAKRTASSSAGSQEQLHGKLKQALAPIYGHELTLGKPWLLAPNQPYVFSYGSVVQMTLAPSVAGSSMSLYFSDYEHLPDAIKQMTNPIAGIKLYIYNSDNEYIGVKQGTEMTIGRKTLPSSKRNYFISRKHLFVKAEEERFAITDLGSTHSTAGFHIKLPAVRSLIDAHSKTEKLFLTPHTTYKRSCENPVQIVLAPQTHMPVTLFIVVFKDLPEELRLLEDEPGTDHVYILCRQGISQAYISLQPGDKTILGRSKNLPHNIPLLVDNPYISGRHISVEALKDGHVLITDLGSTNKTRFDEPYQLWNTAGRAELDTFANQNRRHYEINIDVAAFLVTKDSHGVFRVKKIPNIRTQPQVMHSQQPQKP